MNWQLSLGLWGALFLAYLTVVIMRWSLGKQEDYHLHVSDYEQQLVSVQSNVAHKLDVLDRWKTILLILVIVTAVLLGGLQVYNFWMYSSSTPQFS
jgi:hypothetical protein